MLAEINTFPKVRKHTLCFLKYARKNAPVVLSAQVDMTDVVAYLNNVKAEQKISYISFVISAIAKVIAKEPLANSFYKGGLIPKLVRLKNVNAKLTLDKIINDTRVVVSAVIPETNTLSLEMIQNYIDGYKQSDFAQNSDFKAARILHHLPLWLGQILFTKIMRSPAKASQLQGSFTVTSLGHQPIDLFIPLSGSTLAFGLGQIKSTAEVINNEIKIRPMLKLTLVFDHRVMDGAFAADLLTAIKNNLEKNFTNQA